MFFSLTNSILELVFTLILIPIIHFIASPFVIVGNSMEPTLINGSYILTQKITSDYERGDIVIFTEPEKENVFIVQRIIGLPGENITINSNGVYSNGEILNEPYLDQPQIIESEISIQLKENEYYMLGDNRNESYDSRSFGPVSMNNILSEYILTIWQGT